MEWLDVCTARPSSCLAAAAAPAGNMLLARSAWAWAWMGGRFGARGGREVWECL